MQDTHSIVPSSFPPATGEQLGLYEKSAETLRQLLAQHPRIAQAVVYGSRAMGNYREGSDVDLTLIGEDLTIDDAVQLHRELDDSDIPYLFDVSILVLISNPNLLDHIHRVGKTFYRRA